MTILTERPAPRRARLAANRPGVPTEQSAARLEAPAASQRRGPLEHRLARAQPPPNPLASPEFVELRALRRRLGRGGLPSARTPEDDARIATHAVLSELLRGLEDFRA